jgi:hypothetical protein
MVQLFRRLLVAAIILVGLLGLRASAAEQVIPLISTTTVHQKDAVEATGGKAVAGSPAFADRDGQDVHWFKNADNGGTYDAHPSRYPDDEPGLQLAFFGADIVERMPRGVHVLVQGPVVAGNVVYTTYHGTTLGFKNMANLAAFEQNPDDFMLPAGGYCLRAMSIDNVTPGDPNHMVWIAAAQTWVVFGGAKGPAAMRKMTDAEQLKVLHDADANWRRRTGQPPATSDKVASRQ